MPPSYACEAPFHLLSTVKYVRFMYMVGEPSTTKARQIMRYTVGVRSVLTIRSRLPLIGPYSNRLLAGLDELYTV